MSTRDLARESWREELDGFSRQHEGWIVSITTRNVRGDVTVAARDLPLLGVSPTSPRSSDIAITVGGGGGHLTHGRSPIAVRRGTGRQAAGVSQSAARSRAGTAARRRAGARRIRTLLMTDRETVDLLRQAAVWFEPHPDGFGSLLDAIGDASLVLIGEASHGTHEFYRARAELTKALVLRRGFNIVAVEADWPDAYRANRWVRHTSDDPDAEAALAGFTRFHRRSSLSNGGRSTRPTCRRRIRRRCRGIMRWQN